MDSAPAGVVMSDRRRNDDVGPTDEGDPMTTTELDLDSRLTALEARAPGRDDPPSLRDAGRRRRGRFAVPLAMAPALVLVLVASAVGAGIVATNLARGHEGIQNPGQPLAGAHMECMTPPQAAAFLAAHGFTDVVWQVESGDVKGPTHHTVIQSTPPEHGYVIPGSIVDDGKLHMVIDQQVGASGVGDCFGAPMP